MWSTVSVCRYLRRLVFLLLSTSLLVCLLGPTTSPLMLRVSEREQPIRGTIVAVRGLFAPEIFPIDLATGRLETPIAVPIVPTGVFIAPEGEAFIFRVLGSEIIPVSLARRRVERPIHVGGRIDNVALSPDGHLLYVTIGEHTLAAISTESLRVQFRMELPAGVGDLAVDPSGKTAYVDSSAFITERLPHVYVGGNAISVVNLRRRVVSRVFRLPGIAEVAGVEVLPHELLAASESLTTSWTTLYEVSLPTMRIVVQRALTSIVNGFSVAPNGREAYLNVGTNSLREVDLPNLSVRRTFVVGVDPAGALFTPGGYYMVVATFSGVVIVDLSDCRVVQRIELPPEAGLGGAVYRGAVGLALVPGS
jgi:hypothetical protein